MQMYELNYYYIDDERFNIFEAIEKHRWKGEKHEILKENLLQSFVTNVRESRDLIMALNLKIKWKKKKK